MTADDLHDKWLLSLNVWLDAAHAIPSNREFFLKLTPQEFLIQTDVTGRENAFGPSLDALLKSRLAAEIFLEAKSKGLKSAMLLKLSRQ